MERTKNLQRFVDDFTKTSFGRSLSESQRQSICVVCGKPVGKFRDALSAREFEISGLCQDCQDNVFGK